MNSLFILDASVAVKWFFLEEPLRENALDVRAHLVQRPQDFLVPSLFYTELLHVLVKKSHGDFDFVSQSIDVVLRLGIRSGSLSSDGFSRAVRLTCNGLSGYDATYAALAVENKGKWVTADLKALKKVESRFSLSLEKFKP